MAQTWEDLLFAHWTVPLDGLRRVVPAELTLDTYDGQGWIGITPFVLRGLRLRLTPPVPGLSAFPELNVRTYVRLGGRPGIYFFSLDAASSLAVIATRLTYRLPYFLAAMSAEREGDEVAYSSERESPGGESAGFRARYRPRGPSFVPRSPSLEYFLTERYCLYTLDARRRVHRAEIHHPPWSLRTAEAELGMNTMARAAGIELSGEPTLHYARRQDVLVWPLRRVAPEA
jgi:uncharacterized protein